MTTIACNLEELAGDRLIEWGDGPRFPTDKIGRIRDSLYGYAGHPENALKFLEWRKTPKKALPVFNSDDGEEESRFDVLELNDTGIWLWNHHCVPVKVSQAYYAIGSGSLLAVYHMRNGKSPKRAIELAIQVDKSSGGPVQVLKLHEK